MFISNWHQSFDPTGKVAMRHGFSDHFFIATREAARAAFAAPLKHICSGAKPGLQRGRKLHPEAAIWAALKGANVSIVHHNEIVPCWLWVVSKQTLGMLSQRRGWWGCCMRLLSCMAVRCR